jgi:uncharacterized protein (TIGR03435 family)
MRLVCLIGTAVFASALAISAEGPTFEAASVKVAGSDVRQSNATTGGPGTNDPGRFRAPGIGMLALLTTAFDVSNDQIAGLAWTHGFFAMNYYTIDAVIPPGATKDQFHQMLQNLLVKRFHLVYHREKRDFPGYELVVDKGGPKFKEVTASPVDNPGAPSDTLVRMNTPKGADGFPDVPGSRVIGQGNFRNGSMRTKYQERTMEQFLSNLGYLIGSSQDKGVTKGYLQPRVADKTGLTGRYTFILEYYSAGNASAAAALGVAAPPDEPAASDPSDGLPNIFTAIQKQLGLRLEKVAAVPLEVIVVDSVDKVPTAN